VRAAVRRYRRPAADSRGDQPTVVRTGSLVIDREAQLVTRQGQPVSLTRTEWLLLDALAARLGRVATHRYLLSTVWGEQYIDDTHYVRVYVGALRNKLEDNPAEPRVLATEWGVGYRLVVVPPEDAASPPASAQLEDAVARVEYLRTDAVA
jgi:two-component system KDP operon response regulator KdpE